MAGAQSPVRRTSLAICVFLCVVGSAAETTAAASEPGAGAGSAGSAGARVELPSDFPDDVPRHPGAVATAAASVQGEGVMVTLRIEEPSSQVFAFYRDGLLAADWEIEAQADLGGNAMIVAAKGARRIFVAISGRAASSEVLITVGAAS